MIKPDDLGVEGTALWNEIEEWAEEIRPDEYRLLATACRVLDNMSELQRVFTEQGRRWTVAGSTKQPVSNPLMTEWRFLSERFASLIRQLGIPDTEDRALQRADDISKKMSGLAKLSHRPGSKRYDR